MDAALDRLRRPTTVEDRLDVLARLVAYWHGPLGPDEGLPAADLVSIHIPGPLRWWYARAGRRRDVLSGQNTLLVPGDPAQPWRQLRDEGGRLLFYLENQDVYRWATLFDGDDPPVFGRYEDVDPWEPEGISLSEHLILACLFEAAMGRSPYGAAAAACLDGRTLAELERVITPVSINPWRWLGPTRFYARHGVVMYSMANGTDAYSVWVGARTEGPLQFLKHLVPEDAWEHRAF